MSFEVLESVLRPLAYWYNQENIEEVAINRSGQVWLRLRGKRAYPWVMYKDEKLTKEYLTDCFILWQIPMSFHLSRHRGFPLYMRHYPENIVFLQFAVKT